MKESARSVTRRTGDWVAGRTPSLEKIEASDAYWERVRKLRRRK